MSAMGADLILALEKHSDRLFRYVVDAPAMETFKVRLERILST